MSFDHRCEGDAALAVDVAAIAAVSVAICLAAERTSFMTGVVAAAIAARFAARQLLPAAERATGAAGELLFFAACTLLGGLNDWNTVVRHGVYDYLGRSRAIPAWMLLYWGLILRGIATLCSWRGLDPDAAPRDRVLGRRSPGGKVALELLLVAATRQAIYRFHDHPILSWAPFAAALVAYAALFGLDRGDRRLLLVFAVVGPGVEIAYIQLGGLHAYRLGWLAGVPLWIALWWLLAALIWRDLSARALRGTLRGRSRAA